MTVRHSFLVSIIALPLLIQLISTVWPSILWAYLLVGPYILVGIYDLCQKRKTVLRIYPVIGHVRYLFEYIRPEIQQYFVESDLNGTPISREFRSLVYQRAKKVTDTRPFGTIIDVYNDGYEWINHAMSPKHVDPGSLRTTFGQLNCAKPYEVSPLNISAMSFGSLSRNAILALNRGASMGGFFHNTGEGGISPYHREHGGDLVWQIGTGYFGCRSEDGQFDPELFQQKSSDDQVKMIEIKISQGAKPGHGGILPAAKVTEEIAEIRHVPLGKDVISPSYHTAFSEPAGLLKFMDTLRELSGGKPVGFKLCLGRKTEFLSICKAMLETELTPDFITVDGGEGGTGAAQIEFTNSVGTPLREGLHFIHNALRGIGMRDRLHLIAAGKSTSAYHMVRLGALGADTVNSARGMMFALGCIQARHCNNDKCPSGVATQNPARYRQLDVTDKGVRVFNYHSAMMKALAELLGQLGVSSLTEVKPEHVNRRINHNTVLTYEDVYPELETGFLLNDALMSDDWQRAWDKASATHW
jgi:glutamate synthase domain-containing protein 2